MRRVFILILLFVPLPWLTVRGQEGGPRLRTGRVITVQNPVGAAAADFNRDGKIDLAAVDGSSGNIRIFLQDPADRLQWSAQSLNPLASATLFFIAAADLDGDGNPDLILGNLSSKAFFLLGAGDGAFGNPVTLASSEGSRWISTGDFNGDGLLDLAAAQFSGQTFTVHLATAPGRYAAPTVYQTLSYPHDIEACDFDGDGRLDLMVKLGHTGVLPLRGAGDGTFRAKDIVAEIGIDLNILTPDFNGDGKADLVVDCCAAGIGLGDGRFRKTYTFPAWSPATASADFDGDGKADLAIVFQDPANQINFPAVLQILRGNGDGDFSGPFETLIASIPQAILVRDLDGDGHLDLVLAEAQNQRLEIFWGIEGDPFFGLPRSIRSLTDIRSLAIADLEGDGKPELFFSSRTGNELEVISDARDGFLTFNRRTLPIPRLLTALTPLGRGSSGGLVLAGIHEASQTVSVLALDRAGKVEQHDILFPGLLPLSLRSVDFDQDGAKDLIVSASSSNSVAIFPGLGAGAFGEKRAIPTLPRVKLADAADLDGDGMTDLAVISLQAIAAQYQRTDGTFEDPTILFSSDRVRITDLAIADVTGDRVPDLLAAEANGGRVLLLQGQGARGFDPPVSIATGVGPISLSLGDLDGDGRLDFLTANGKDGTVSAVYNLGIHGWSDPINAPLSFNPIGQRLFDLNGDGALELVAFGLYQAAIFPGEPAPHPVPRFRRGDVDGQGAIDVSDVVAIVSRLYLAGAELPCVEAADANDDGAVDGSDAVSIIQRLFLGGLELPPPGGADCGVDPTVDGLGCGAGC